MSTTDEQRGWALLEAAARDVSMSMASAALENQRVRDEQRRERPPTEGLPKDNPHPLETPEEFLARRAAEEAWQRDESSGD